MYQANMNYYQYNQYNQNPTVATSNECDRNSNSSPASSVGLGSSIASSPSPSHSSSDSPSVSPTHIVNSTPSAYYQHSHTVYHPQPTYNNYYQNQAYYEQYKQASDGQYYHQSQLPYSDDSTYYSRNNSINQSLFNDSLNNNYAAHFPQQIKLEVQVKPKLKFSIDSILGNDEKSDKKALAVGQETHDANPKKRRLVSKQNGESKSNNSNKRLRTIFTQDQLDRLEEEFTKQQYMVGSERSYLAKSMNLSESQVKIWFQNRRIKWRKTQYGGSGGTEDNTHDNDASLNDDSTYDD